MNKTTTPTISRFKSNFRREIKIKMVLLENEQFLTELTKFYQKAKQNGSVMTTMKRYDGKKKPISRKTKKQTIQNIPEPQEYKCLIRSTLGSKKISTIVTSKDINKFQLAYSNVLKGNIELKKKEKDSNKKSSNKTQKKATQ